jgi:predicted nucleotidyltransferase
MPLSKHYLDTQEEAIPVETEAIAQRLMADFPQIAFALLLGSAAGGVIAPHRDLDLAVFCTEPLSLEQRASLIGAIEDLHRGVRCDLGILNAAEPVYRFETLQGRLLFTRDEELWLRFFSATCREYESQMFHYDRQRRYRLANRSDGQDSRTV